MIRPTAPRASAIAVADQTAAAGYGWRVLSVTSLGVVLVFLNSSSLDVALPAVSKGLQASPLQASWFLLAYTLVSTVLILVFGRLSDIYGRRSVYLGGMAVLTLGSLACALAQTPSQLIGLRALQAVGAAAVVTNTTALLTEAFPRHLLSRGLGINAGVAAVSQVFGPLLGGICVSRLNWRWVFGIGVPIGLVGLVWGFAVLRSLPRTPTRESFDVLGALLIATSLGGLVLLLLHGGNSSWVGAESIAAATALVLGLGLFVLLERRRVSPLVDLTLLQNRSRAAAYLACFLMAVAQFSVVLLASLYLQVVRHDSALQAGLRVLPMAIGVAITAPLAGISARRYSSRLLSTAGMIIIAGGVALLMATLSARTSYPELALGLLIVGVGTGLFMTPNTSDLMASIPSDRLGIGNGLRSTLQNAGFAVSSAVSLGLIAGGLPEARYSGGTADPPVDLSRAASFVHGERRALLVLLGCALIGALVSALRVRVEGVGPR